ncbi:excalibur calcium-binding domain-containing protein [Mycobacterium sp. GA-1285]|nr:excalibur calcium-binding domain-containing protein [Mycobacterium sp. GA-1285]
MPTTDRPHGHPAASRAGAAPLMVGDPGCRPALDRDSDGVACES